MIGKNDFDIASHDLAESYREDDRQVMETRQKKVVEEIVEHDKNIKWVETFKAPVIDDAGDLLGTVGFSRNISERKAIEAELQIAAIAFESQEGMIITDTNSIILKIKGLTYINTTFRKIRFSNKCFIPQRFTCSP